ncbi:MAG TPA: hypothetical protein VHZ97_17920, partial [Pseudonocardiaceae bacterium]|nr:hypothetical protein [Pseudonocardiaceae bacterium]
AEECPPLCGHLGPPQDPDCRLDEVVAEGTATAGRLASLRRLLLSRAGIVTSDGTENDPPTSEAY